MKRKSGVLLHISSLPGNYGCGSFGAEARHFIDVIAASGFSYWQVLPFCIPDSFASPYSSVSTFSGNPNFIDLDILFSNGLVTRAELESARAASPYSCDFGELHKKEFIGDESRKIECDDIRRANRLMYASSAVMLAIAMIFRCVLVGGVLL